MTAHNSPDPESERRDPAAGAPRPRHRVVEYFNLLDLGRPGRIVLFQTGLMAIATLLLLVIAHQIGLRDPVLSLSAAQHETLDRAVLDSFRLEHEVWARIAWGAIALLFYGVGVAAVGNALRITAHSLRDRDDARALLVFVLVAVVVGFMIWGGIEWNVHWGPPVLGQLLHSMFEHRHLRGVLHALGVMNGLAGGTAIATFWACAATVFAPVGESRWTEQELGRRLSWLRSLLLLGASLLTLGVMSIGLIYRWMAAYVPPTMGLDIGRIGEGATVGVGVVCSAALFVSYVPPALALRGKAESLAPGKTNKERQDWLKDNGFALTPLDVALRLGSALAPLVLGSQLPSFLSSMPG